MSKRCFVKGCTSNDEKGHPFPTDRPAISTKWLKALEGHQTIPPNYQTKLICSSHFLESDFLKSRGKLGILTRKAVPSIFPEVSNCDGDESEEEEKVSQKPSGTDDEDEEGVEEDENSSEPFLKKVKIESQCSDEENDSDFENTDEDSDEDAASIEENEQTGNNYNDEEESMDKLGGTSQNSESANEFATTANGNVPTLDLIGLDEEIDSDYEPVTEESVRVLQEKISKKTNQLDKERVTLKSIEEMIKNQSSTIIKLEDELVELVHQETEYENRSDGSGASTAAANTSLNELIEKGSDYSNLDMQLFAISLYYFSPKVYTYLKSIMPYLPPKEIVIDWVKSGYATRLFPSGILTPDKFNIN